MQIIDADGNPVAGATIKVSDTNDKVVYDGVTGSNGIVIGTEKAEELLKKVIIEAIKECAGNKNIMVQEQEGNAPMQEGDSSFNPPIIIQISKAGYENYRVNLLNTNNNLIIVLRENENVQ